MSVFESIFNFLKNKEETKTAPDGFCPNCWGRQEYEGKFFEAMENQNVDVNNFNEKKGWVQDYADKYLAGIQVKPQDEDLTCSKCKLSYKPS